MNSQVGKWGQLSFAAAFAVLCNSVFAVEPPSESSKQKVSAPPASIERWVDVQRGDLPIIISAPHGGSLRPPGVEQRKGESLPDDASRFVVLQDYGTEPLARAVAHAIEQRFGRKPYFVISRLHRRYLDPNRPPSEAFEHDLAGRVYRRYHDHLDRWCREMGDRFQGGLLIDLHGQARDRDTVFRGTQNGLTVKLLRQRFGESAHFGSESLFGLLRQQNWKVHPDPLNGREQSGYNGGHIVRTYGSHKTYPVDAIQLELGRSFRSVDARRETAGQLAAALQQYADRYLKLLPPIDLPIQTDRLEVAVYVGKGTGASRKHLLAALGADPSLSIRKLDEFAIRGGKLIGCDVLVHPGGSGGGQGRALGSEGRAVVRDFIQNGGGYLGICAGAYLATCDYSWSLNVLDARVIDKAHWNRGHGSVKMELSNEGKQGLGVSESNLDILYWQGPLLAPAANDSIDDYQPWAWFRSEVEKKGVPSGVMPGTTAIAAGQHGSGRVICFSPHPEKTEGQNHLVLAAVRWLAN